MYLQVIQHNINVEMKYSRKTLNKEIDTCIRRRRGARRDTKKKSKYEVHYMNITN